MSLQRIEEISNIEHAGIVDCHFNQIANSSMRIPCLPSFMFGDVPGAVLKQFHAHAGLPRQGAWFIRDVDITGHYLISIGGILLKDHLSNIHELHVRQAVEAQANAAVMPVRRKISGQQVLLCGPGLPIYGHWLVEMLPKLHVLEVMRAEIEHLSFLIPSDLPQFAARWLNLLGIGDDQIVRYDPRGEVVSVDELVIPSIMHNGVRVGSEFAKAAHMLARRVEEKLGQLKPSELGHKIFLSRRNTGANRQLINREVIEQIARENGFSIVCPEALSLPDQISLFKAARYVVGDYGSALHGTMFSAPDTVVCGLRGSETHPGFIQSGIGRILQQPTGYIFGLCEPGDPLGSYTIPEDDFRECLRLVFSGIPLERLPLDMV
jgi:hypothetical protein